MPYYKVLRKVVAESNLTSKEIVEKCNKMGRKIDKSYMSKLLNNKLPAPSEEVSREIAKICNVDERILVLEGYIDKAPKEIKEIFDSIRFMTTLAGLQLFKNKIDKKTLNELEKELKKEPLSEFLISIIDEKANGINYIDYEEFEIEGNNHKLSLKAPLGLQIKDNAMFPMISQKSKITLEMKNEYENGDILAIKEKNENDFIVRYAMFSEDKITLTPLNREYKTLTYKKDDIVIIGKVKEVITDI